MTKVNRISIRRARPLHRRNTRKRSRRNTRKRSRRNTRKRSRRKTTRRTRLFRIKGKTKWDQKKVDVIARMRKESRSSNQKRIKKQREKYYERNRGLLHECPICMEPNVHIYPMCDQSQKHKGCDTCVKDIYNRGMKCPICRGYLRYRKSKNPLHVLLRKEREEHIKELGKYPAELTHLTDVELEEMVDKIRIDKEIKEREQARERKRLDELAAKRIREEREKMKRENTRR